MTEFNTSKRDYFKAQQSLISSDNIYDLEKAFLSQLISKDLEEVNVPSDWRVYFSLYGYTDSYTTNLSELWYRWFTEKGFTRANLRNKFKDFYDDGTVTMYLGD